jgi:hypothetical protein
MGLANKLTRLTIAVPRLSGFFGATKINSSEPPLPAVCTAYATPPFLPFFHPVVELAGGCQSQSSGAERGQGRVEIDWGQGECALG